MQYHKAAFIGTERSRNAQMKLFEYTGFSMLTYTIKQGKNGFEPVGEEMLVGKLTKGDEMLLFICDNQGYAKAQSKPIPTKNGEEIYKKMVDDGLNPFVGDVITVG